MKLTNKLAVSSAVLAIVAAAPAAVYAQQTSSVVTGQVTDASGAPVAGATVTITHIPSGTRKTVVASDEGVYFASGLRVGGPFQFTASGAGGVGSRSNISLQPGTGNVVGIRIVEAADTIVIRGEVGSSIDLNNGVGSNFSGQDLLDQPSVARDLVQTLLRDPLASSDGEGQISVAGVNPRFSALAIDGSLQGDDFGLSDSIYATARTPISLDVIEAAAVVASDYSVKSSGFTGGLINVVTKSGGNEIDGSVYYYFTDDTMFGDQIGGDFVETADFQEDEYGFYLSGPIIKDKLFFIVNYDKFETGDGANFVPQDEADGINPALFDEVNQLLLDTYGFDAGGRPSAFAIPEETERFFAKIDWNINNDHRASFSYQSVEETTTSGVSQTNFLNTQYDSPQEIETYTFQMFSDWTNALSTELRVNFKDNARDQNCRAGDTVGNFDIRLSEDDVESFFPGQGLLDDGVDDNEDQNILFLDAGCDRFRQGNTFEDERLQIFAAANYTTGNHFITLGLDFEDYELDNLFAQRSIGLFQFETLENVENQLSDNVTVQLPISGVREDIRAVWGFNRLALFAQDSWQISSDLRVDYGVRYERIFQDDEPPASTFFEDVYGFSNQENLDGLDLIMPRIGFEYTPLDRTKITGGFGLFSGGDPKVWTSNAFTPAQVIVRQDDVTLDNGTGTPSSVINAVQDQRFGPIDVIAPGFETPSDWKASLRLDQEFDLRFGNFDFGDDYTFTTQIIYTVTNQGFLWRNFAQTNDIAVDVDGDPLTPAVAVQPTGVAPDGRPIYADLQDLGISNAIALDNFDDGESLAITVGLAKQYDNGIAFNLAYAYQDVESVTPGTSSRGVSNYRGIIDSDRNNPSAFDSEFEIAHQFKLFFQYEKEIIPGALSRFNLFGTIQSGDNFSYTFNTSGSNALFGRPGDSENPFDNDLLYVPAISNGAFNDPSVVFSSGFDQGQFLALVRDQGLTPGAIQDRNSDRSAWTQLWNFQWQQEVPLFGLNEKAERYVGDNRLLFVMDIFNVANLLNNDWGRQRNGPGFDTEALVGADIVSAADVAANGVDGATALTGDAPRTTCTTQDACLYRFNFFDSTPDTTFDSLNQSVWQVRLGLRYEF
ncbi:MAG: carboxypeptidase regulatory-like domain-containing protein [Pseudomonadota bacterium]